MESPKNLYIFQAYGIELEYMIVDKTTLAVRPISDELLKSVLGTYGSDVERGDVTWSNELVLHVIEIKCTEPTAQLVKLNGEFHKNIQEINQLLEPFGAMIMPTAAHPYMHPDSETKLWPHDNSEIYDAYNRIFDCRGHGWSNLQSTHINLPFTGDEEFAKLHAAIRIALPILPALAASSPILDGQFTGFLDRRLFYYQNNQKRIPALTGRVIPEPVFSHHDYQESIYQKIKQGIQPFDTDHILEPVWLNSRGAIARFDRGSIEIRILDIQECPAADMSIIALIITLLRWLADEKVYSFEKQVAWEVAPLYEIFNQVIEKGENTVITNQEYLACFGAAHLKSPTAGELWQWINQELLAYDQAAMEPWQPYLKTIFEHGTLASRVLQALQGNYSKDNLNMVYRRLSDCVAQNLMFIPT